MNKTHVLVVIAIIAAIFLRFHKEDKGNSCPEIAYSGNAILVYNQTAGSYRHSLKHRSSGPFRRVHTPPSPYPNGHF